MNKIVTSIKIIDTILGDGIEKGWIVEFYGDDWNIVLKLMHIIISRLLNNYQYKILVIYNQLFGGIDPLSINFSSTLNLLFIRSFRNEDLLSIIKNINDYQFDILIIIDPYLHTIKTLTTRSKASYTNTVTSGLWKLLSVDSPILIFNRAYFKYPYGGFFHHHLIHVLIFIKLLTLNRKQTVLLKRIKHPYLPPKDLITEINSITRNDNETFLSLEKWTL